MRIRHADCDCGRVQYRTRGSGEESAFSVFVVDRKDRTIWQIRCGAGAIITLLIDGKGINNYEEIYGIIIYGGNIFDIGGIGV